MQTYIYNVRVYCSFENRYTVICQSQNRSNAFSNNVSNVIPHLQEL